MDTETAPLDTMSPVTFKVADEKKALDDGLFERLKAAISTYNHQFGVEGYSEVADPAPTATTKEAPKAEAKAEAKSKVAAKKSSKPKEK